MEGDPRNPRVSLLRKYDIPVENLSYEYVESCSGKKELERIIRILRLKTASVSCLSHPKELNEDNLKRGNHLKQSGEEGFYPDLLKVAEERLRQIAPESRALRVETPILTKDSLTNEEWAEVENEILSWEKEMTVMDKSLDFEKSRLEVVGNKNMPAIRKVVEAQPKKKEQKESKSVLIRNNTNSRIKSGDYAAWDKFDVDKELLKLDIEEERKQEQNDKKKREAKKLQQQKNKIEIVDNVDKDSYSSMEQLVLANQAKDRGNECYKSGDLENARKYYDISIKLHPTANAYNNRAMTHIKLGQYKSAIEDCNKVLQLEKNNVKALHRRATAYQNLVDDKENVNFSQLALQDLHNIILLEPNNKVVQTDLQKLKKKLNIEDSGKKFRLQISEIGSDVEGNAKLTKERLSPRNAKDSCVPAEKLPLTYYGPSTSTFQCEPYSMVHRTLSGSYIPGQVLCKCNSNRLRQNPLCQRCGEAMCTPKPVIKSKKEADKPKIETLDAANEIKIKPEEKSTDSEIDKRDSVKSSGGGEFVNRKVSENVENDAGINSDLLMKSSRENGTNLTVESKCENSKSDASDGNDEHGGSKINAAENVENETKHAEPEKQVLVQANSINNKLVSKMEGDKEGPEARQDSQKKAHKKKKKSKEQKEMKALRKHLEPMKLEPVKIVQSAKYLHPTSVEPKVKTESQPTPRREMSQLDNTTQFKAFVPNKKCYIPECRLLGPNFPQGGKPPEPARSEEGSESSREGNKENILESVEKTGREESVRGKKKVESAFEFMKTWEELKKVDESFSRRAEIIREIAPSDLKNVIGIKLDSDMLSSLLECLERHFAETDPRVVVEFLKYLPEVPRFGLVIMFLADSDREKMKKLVEVAEGKGFKMDDETKKSLTIS